MQSALESAVQRKIQGVIADIASAQNNTDTRLIALRNNINKVVNIPVKDIRISENIRKELDEDSENFQALVESVKRYGVLASAVVELREYEDGRWELICVAGHRRILAAQKAGTPEKIPCLLKCFNSQADRIGMALAENLNREPLHCLDIAHSYAELIRYGWTEHELATHFDRDIRTVRHYLKINSWPEDVHALLRKHKDIFSTRVILREFAYRSLTHDELRAAIQKKIHEKSSPTKKMSRKLFVQQKIVEFFKERNVSPEVQALVIDLLQQLKLVSKRAKNKLLNF